MIGKVHVLEKSYTYKLSKYVIIFWQEIGNGHIDLLKKQLNIYLFKYVS